MSDVLPDDKEELVNLISQTAEHAMDCLSVRVRVRVRVRIRVRLS